MVEARAFLSQGWPVLDDVENMTACAQDLKPFLMESKLTEPHSEQGCKPHGTICRCRSRSIPR